MRRALPLVASLAVAVLPVSLARAQARGPAAEEIQEHGQHITMEWELRQQAQQQAQQQADEEREQERIALRDPAVRAKRFADLNAFLRRLPGRFRIDGTYEKSVYILPPPAPRSIFDPPQTEGRLPLRLAAPMRVRRGGSVKRHTDITGIADCQAVGDGAGLSCVLSASWPEVGPVARLDSLVPISFDESLNNMRPAMLVLGVNTDPPGIRALFVTAETLAYDWVGRLNGTGARLTPPDAPCPATVTCYPALEIKAEPESDVVSFVFETGAVTATFVMHRDPLAKLKQALKPLQTR